MNTNWHISITVSTFQVKQSKSNKFVISLLKYSNDFIKTHSFLNCTATISFILSLEYFFCLSLGQGKPWNPRLSVLSQPRRLPHLSQYSIKIETKSKISKLFIILSVLVKYHFFNFKIIYVLCEMGHEFNQLAFEWDQLQFD